MLILQALPDLWQSLNSLASMPEMLSIACLYLLGSFLVTIIKSLWRILNKLLKFCAVCLTRAKKKLQRQPQSPQQQALLQQIQCLEQELQALQSNKGVQLKK